MTRGIAPIALGLILGRRLPVTSGSLRVDGVEAALTIRRDRWGVPHVEAANGVDAWFGLGFAQGQDRAFQLEMLLRVVRGTLSEIIGPVGLPVDRLSRRIGFARAGRLQVGMLRRDVRAAIEAFARGVNAAHARGLRRRPHELALLRAGLTPWTAADVLGVLKVESFALSSNWDIELARLRVITDDGPEALRDLDPTYPEWHPVAVPPGGRAGRALERLAEEARALAQVAGVGGSNNWALAASRTSTGRPLLANDPHLAPTTPGPWYLAHLRTPEWSLAGAAFVGGPAIPTGHNGHAAWGVTAGLADTTDCFIEEVGPDGTSVREGDRFEPCEVLVERIGVKGQRPVEERVLITRRGPIIGPALAGDHEAISFKASWLEPKATLGLLGLHRVRDFESFRRCFEDWREVSLNMAYADANGTIGYQLVGEVPRRVEGDGSVPQQAKDVGPGWREDWVPFDAMPSVKDPPGGWIASANTQPRPAGEASAIGGDFIDGYRLARINERIAEGRDRDVRGAMRAQMDLVSIPWREMREIVLDAARGDPAVADARALLEAWDGHVDAGSAAAAVYELLVADLCVTVARLRAPKSYPYMLGTGFNAILPLTMLVARRVGHLVGLLRERDGWCGHPWDELIRASLAGAWAAVRARPDGRKPATWGELRPMTLVHAFTGRRPIDRAFDIGPFPWGGDANTVSQACVDPQRPLGNPLAAATMRAVIDVGNWEGSRFVIATGQSGNPCSPHYDDLHELWKRGDGVPIAWSDEAVAKATKETLRLEPA